MPKRGSNEWYVNDVYMFTIMFTPYFLGYFSTVLRGTFHRKPYMKPTDSL